MTKKVEVSVEERLRALYDLQLIDSRVDEIRNVRGELPLEVQDLEDEVEGLNTRLEKLSANLELIDNEIASKKNLIEEAKGLIKKYSEQQKNVRNNREYDSLSKEIEYQSLEIELCEKRIREFTVQMTEKTETLDASKAVFEDRNKDLEAKKGELDEIIEDTKKEEKELIDKSEKLQTVIEPRLITAYSRIRNNARNGLAVVTIKRDACGGCFNKIPPQRQLDIKSRKKITVCEYCGRILVDDEIVDVEN